MIDLETTLKIDKILSSENLVNDLSEKDLNSISKLVCEGYETDKQSRQEWEDKIEEWTNLALQVAEKKMFPWPNAANVKYPLITTAALQFSARAYPALLPGMQPVRGRVIGFDTDGSKLDRAIRIGKHMSFQLLEQMDDWEEEMDRLLFALPIVGCIFKKTYYSASLERNVSEIVYPRELVVNYWSKTLEDSERITHVLHLTENDVHERVVGGIFAEEDYKKPSIEELKKRNTDEPLGQEKPQTEDETLPFLFLEQCLYLDIDNDGYKEPYIVTLDKGSSKIARIVARFSQEDIKYNSKNEIIKIIPVNFYTKFSFIPSPDGGFYDIGFGVILGPINDTINTLINQLLDAGTLSNLQSGFISKGIRIKGGAYTFTPGEWKYVNTIGDDLRKGLLPLPVREPSQVLFSLLGMMVTAGEKLSSVTEVMTGEIPGQNTKATVAMAAIEQGMKVFSSIYKRIHRSLAKEYKKLFKLNSIYLNEEEYFTILDVGQEQGQEIGRKDYLIGDIDVAPMSDPNVATEQQKLAKIEVLMQLLQFGTVNIQEVTRRFLEATEQPNIEALMKVPEPQPDPEIEANKAKAEFEQVKFEDESLRKWKELELREVEGHAKSMLTVAQAEALEPGTQMEQYHQALNLMTESITHNQKYRQAEEIHQQKMQQMQEMNQIKKEEQPREGTENEDRGNY
jgi:chaperonin GroES